MYNSEHKGRIFFYQFKSCAPLWIIPLLTDFVGKKNKKSVLLVVLIELFWNLDEEQLKLTLV